MKKYIAIVIVIGLIVGSILVYFSIKVKKESEQTFTESGYILQSTEDKKLAVDRFYFKANSIYKKNYGDNIEFVNTDGEKVETNKDNFIHYTNGAIGSFKNGVLINLNQLNDRLITYYNISKDQILSRKNNAYTIPHLGNDLVFTSLLWKISDKKYLIAADNITLSLGNEEGKKNIKGYIEVEYRDNEIIKIYNQEIAFLTISPEAYVELQDGARINLASKIVSYREENKLSIDSMVIDLDENVTIADLNQYDDTLKNEANNNILETNSIENENAVNELSNSTNNVTNTTIANVGNSNSGSSSNANGGNGEVTVIINDGDGNGSTSQSAAGTISSMVMPGDDDLTDNEAGDDSEELVDESAKVNSPTYKVVDFESTSLGIKTSISIDDKDSLLTDDSRVEIIQEETGRKVYDNRISQGVYDFDIEVSDLAPDTDYTMTISSSYKIDDINYNKNFIYKTFKTKPIGLSITKDSYTDSSVAININYEKDTLVKSLEVQLIGPDGTIIGTKPSVNSGNGDNSEIIEFTKTEFERIQSNTDYTVVLQNLVCEDQIIANAYVESENVQTLKQKPTISNTEFEIDKRNSTFKLSLNNVIDPDAGINGYRFEIFDIRSSSEEPVMSINSNKTEVTVSVDGNTLSRNIGYIYRVIALFNDNEKDVEYESEFSDIMKMDGSQFPTLNWTEEIVTFERIKGIISIEDKENTVSLKKGDTIRIVYKNSLGDERSITTEGTLSIPIDENNLRKNETYKFSVYGKVDLHDGNDVIDECYIGSVVVKTKEPKNMVARMAVNKEDNRNTFNVRFKLEPENNEQGELEPETLTGLTFSIYAGQTLEGNLPSGAPRKTVKLVDTNPEAYESELKEKYYDNTFDITPEFFSSSNKDFKDKYYTIVVSEAYDYTDYKNGLPILKNVFTFESKGHIPDYPSNPNDAVTVEAIRNKNSGNPRDDLEAETLVGYKVTAVYNNVDKYARKFIYKVFDADTNELIETRQIDADKNSINVPSTTFSLNDGLDEDDDDGTLLRRGHKYYFTYEALLALDSTDESVITHYPEPDEDGKEVVLKSQVQKAYKQGASVEMFPLNSQQTSYKIAYKITDIDNIIYKDDIVLKINDIVRDTEKVTKNTNSFKEITFDEINKGDLKIVINQKAINTEQIEEVECINHYFEGINTVENVRYRIETDENKVKFVLEDANKQLDNILAYKAVFKTSDGTTITKDMLTSQENIINLKYSAISELKGKNITAELYAYYDSGNTGYALDQTKYVTYQKPYKSTDDEKYYYQIDEKNNFIDSPGQIGNIYSAIRADDKIAITNKCTNRQVVLDVYVGKTGIEYNGNILLQKQVEQTSLVCKDLSNSFRFDTVTTEISVTNSSGNHDIDADLTTASFSAKLSLEDTIADGKITIDLYETDEDGKTAKSIRSIEKNVSDFANTITIPDLTPKTYYFIQFKAKYRVGANLITKYLYDTDYDIAGKQYFFSTLAKIEITNLSVKYDAKSYTDKSIEIKYDIDKIMGYTRIEYTIQKFNRNTNTYEEFGVGIEADTFFTNEMKKNIPITPNVQQPITFNEKYMISIKPLVDKDGIITEIGTKNYEFTLSSPRTPSTIISSQRQEKNDNKYINFRVVIYDNDYVVPNQKYKVRILKNQTEDVTPNEYKDNEYDIKRLRKLFVINNIDGNADYTFEITTNIDMNNNTQTEPFVKSKTSSISSGEDISIGKVSAQTNLNEGIYRINLVFTESYNLKDLTDLRYTIYNESGYVVSGVDDNFKPIQSTDAAGNMYYTYLIDNNMNNCSNGEYYIELQFYKNDKLIDNESISYMYIV